MRSFARSCLVAVIVAGLLNLPAMAAADKPLGMVIQAQDAQLDNAKAAIGATVYPGDALATNLGGTLRLKVGASQLYLLSASTATLAQNADKVRATVARGTVGFSSSASDQLELEIPEGILRAADGQPAYGQVTISKPNEVVISAYRGALVLDNEGELHLIGAGKSYRVTMDMEPEPQGPAGTGTGKGGVIRAKRRHLAFALVMIGAAGTASYFIWRELSESPSRFSN